MSPYIIPSLGPSHPLSTSLVNCKLVILCLKLLARRIGTWTRVQHRPTEARSGNVGSAKLERIRGRPKEQLMVTGKEVYQSRTGK